MDEPQTARVHRSDEGWRLYEQERLVAWATERISEAMEDDGVTKADLARTLGTSRANITALLSGSRNMTLRTLADVAWALGTRVEVSLVTLPARSKSVARIAIPREAIADFCGRNHVCRLALFGSVLRDDFGPESDVDVLVEFEEGKTPGLAFFTLHEELEEIFGRPVDLHTFRSVEQNENYIFRKDALSRVETIYDAAA